jgi:HPt (histidine-containing phosphotransfer) domain-containing protein
MNGSPIDPAVVAQVYESVGADPAFLDELADAYLADAPVQLEAVRLAIRAGSPADLVRPAHTLKSSSATIGAMTLSAIARELELAARDGSISGAEARAEAAGDELERVRSALAELRARRWMIPGAGT